jgi:hypothetical protein
VCVFLTNSGNLLVSPNKSQAALFWDENRKKNINNNNFSGGDYYRA